MAMGRARIGPVGQGRFWRVVDALDRGPRRTERSEFGDEEDGTGEVFVSSYPAWAWVLDGWLERGHPHWGWWYEAWRRVSPHWGDAFCAAYCAMWVPIYGNRWRHEESRVNVGFAYLSEEYRRAYARRRTESVAWERNHLDGVDDEGEISG
jgi:hypothetical protein